MSSRSRTWPERAAALAAATLLGCAPAAPGNAAAPGNVTAPRNVTAPGNAAAPGNVTAPGNATAPGRAAAPTPSAAAPAAAPLPVVTTLPGADGRSLLVLDLGAAPGPGRRILVEQDGVPLVASGGPVAGPDLGVTLVVDSSSAGAGRLPAWLSAAARFILEAPPQARAVVVTASAPAVVAIGPRRGPVDVVRALESVRAHGERDIAGALSLAAWQFPENPPGHKAVVLYTSARDAGGETAAALAARYRARGLLLVVVGPAGAERFWGAAASATGGFFAPAGDPVVVPALDQVRTTLRGRYLVEFPTPERLPATVSVAVTAGAVRLTGRAVIPAPADPPGGGPGVPVAVWWLVAGLGLAALIVVAVVLLRRPAVPGTAGEPGGGPAAVARGRAPMAHDEDPGVARGRAAVRPAIGPPARRRRDTESS